MIYGLAGFLELSLELNGQDSMPGMASGAESELNGQDSMPGMASGAESELNGQDSMPGMASGAVNACLVSK
jgi:hypothetical protein